MPKTHMPCSKADPELFFPLSPNDAATISKATQICYGCLIREECGQGATERGEQFGIWGGMTPEERRTLARVWGAQPIRVPLR